MRQIRARLSYANVMATLAVFIALGGTATAAVLVTGREVSDGSLTGRDLRDRSVGTRDLAPSSVSGNRIKDGSLTARDLKDRTLGLRDLSLSLRARLGGAAGPQGERGPQLAGAAGPQGERGPQGPQGERGPGSTPVSTTGATQTNYPSDATLVQLALPSTGLLRVRRGDNAQEPELHHSRERRRLRDSRRHSGGRWRRRRDACPRRERTLLRVGGTEIADVTQPMRAACNHDGTLEASAIRMFALKLSD